MEPLVRAMHPILAKRPFEPGIELVSIEPLGGEGAHSGSAYRVVDEHGEAYKLRACGSAARAREIASLTRALPWLCPDLVSQQGPYLLYGLLADHRALTRHELLDRAAQVGALVARLHATGRRTGVSSGSRRLAASLRWLVRFILDLGLVAGRSRLPAGVVRAVVAKASRRAWQHGLPVELELGDVHKDNFMWRSEDDDLRFVDEEGIGLAPRGVSLGTLLKTANGSETLEAFRSGYASVAPADWLEPGYVEWLLLQDAVRRVAHKLRSGRRTEKLPDELGEIRALAASPEPDLAWRFPKDAIRAERRARRQAARAAAAARRDAGRNTTH